MADGAPVKAEDGARSARPRRWRRWLVRLVLLAGLGLAVGGSVVYWKRTALVNRLLREAVPGLNGSIRESAFDFPSGGVMLRDVVFRDPRTGREALRVAELRAAILNGTYEIDAKLDVAVDRLLDEIA